MFGFIRKLINQAYIRYDSISYARRLGVKVGSRCKFMAATGGTFGTEPYLIELGDHVEVSFNVRFITHDGGVWVCRDRYPDLDVIDKIVVGNNVFIGAGSILLPGTRIGENCVIGAGSVVRGEVPSGSVFAGTPAKYIKSTDDYISGCIKKGINTKQMSPSLKKKHLLQHDDFSGEQ
jgi:acetyltransferase-like isoleucine patch superfamily enzyme